MLFCVKELTWLVRVYRPSGGEKIHFSLFSLDAGAHVFLRYGAIFCVWLLIVCKICGNGRSQVPPGDPCIVESFPCLIAQL